MSTPEGPDRRGRDGSEGEQAGEAPTWGTPPPGGWGQADPDSPASGGTPQTYDAWPDQGRDPAPGSGQTGGWAQTGGAGETGAWAPTGEAQQTGGWAPTGGAGGTGAWAPSGEAQQTGGWAQTGGAGQTGAWAPTGETQSTGGWAPAGGAEQPGGWSTDPGAGGGHRRDDGWNQQPAPGWDGGHPGAPEQAPQQPVWGDEATTATPAPGGRRRRAEEPADAWGGGGADPARPGAWGPGPEERFAPGDEPWAPNEAVRPPRRGPFGLAPAVVAGIGAGVVLIVVALVLLFVAPGFAVTRTLDKTALQNGVTQVLTQDYKLQVGSVDCPDDVEVATGTAFACQALVDGEQVTVAGRVTSDEGDYQVGRV